MIDSVTVSLDTFDLRGFVDTCADFHKTLSGGGCFPASLLGIVKHGDTPSQAFDDDADVEDVMAMLQAGEAKLFFLMHEPIADNKFLCIDGEHRDSDDVDIGVADGYGYLVEVDDLSVSLHPALYDGSSGPYPRIDLQGTCSVLEKPMKQFVSRFMKASGS